MKCSGYETNSGCPDEDFCISEMLGNCPNYCPPQCNKNQHVCKGPIIDGCHTEDICVKINPNCPNTCPTFCHEGEMECPQEDDDNGCPLPVKCIPKNKS